ncbi:MAG: SusC/RagA family TonB-linked outer membrane protein [Prolixibacteraceae bacterium]|jgi:TonB-linked SusC/RagA family outer membrane protein|nr:SusC/RagA family TonB-linked outer membrane protein [Prolixibacteraceae bacterium]
MMKRKMLKAMFLCILMVVSSGLFAQNIVTGNVKDDTGQTLPGVSVVVKGTTTGTVTDINGKFSLSAPANATLSFSFVGMQTKEVAIGNSRKIDVTLVASTIGVDEVVVTALGISREKKSLAYSVSEVKGNELTKGAGSNVLKALDGRVSGVNFTQTSSDPAGSVFVTIRGATSLNITQSTVASQPLYVIDGIPLGTTSVDNRNGADFGNLLSQINPEDIESISILKGASAGALYGSAAGNGVIMITTKSGKGGKKGIGVSVNTSIMWDKPFNFFTTQLLYGDGIRASSIYTSGYDWGAKFADFTNAPIDGYNTLTQRIETKLFAPTRENRLQEYMQTGATRNYNVSVTGNYKDGAFRFSIGKMSNVGVMPNNSTERMNASLSAEYNITKKLKISVNSNYMGQFTPNKTSSNSDVIEEMTMDFLGRLQPIKEMKTVWKTGFEGQLQNAPFYKPDGTPMLDNPYMYAYSEINTYRKDNFFGKVQLDYEIIKALKFMVRSGIDYTGNNYEYKRAKDFVDSNKRDGKYSVNQGNGLSVQNDLMLVWNKEIGKFSTNATAGYNYAYSNSYSYSANAEKLVRVNDYSLGNAVAGTLTSSSGWGIGKSQSYYATGQVGYANQIFVDVSGRYDKSGILEEDKNHHFYPSASLSWLPSTTFKLPEAISMLKLRAGVAQVGHGIGTPRSNNTFSFSPIDYGTAKIVNIGGSLVDPKIKAEVTTSYEGGFDLSLFKNRVSAEFTVYKKVHENQQGAIPTSPGIGYGGMLTNVGTVEANGYEVSLNLVPVRTKDWNWDLGFNFSQVTSKITELSKEYVPNGQTFYGNGPNIDLRLAKGEVIGTMWAHQVFTTMPATSKYAGMIVLDNNGEWKYSNAEKDRQSIGNYNPDFILGAHSSLKWKNFRLGLVGSLRMGGKYISDIERRAVTDGHSLLTIGDKVNGPNPWTVGGRDAETGGLPWPDASKMPYPQQAGLVATYAMYGTPVPISDACYFKGVWLKPGGNPANDADYIVNGADPLQTFYAVPGLILGAQYWSFPQSLLRDATNFKLKEITFDYTIPNKYSSKYRVENIVVGFVGRNIFQWNAADKYVDPESAFGGIGQNQGIVGKALPSIASYGFKVSFDF